MAHWLQLMSIYFPTPSSLSPSLPSLYLPFFLVFSHVWTCFFIMFRLFSSHCHQLIITELHFTNKSWLESQLGLAVPSKGVIKRMNFFLFEKTSTIWSASRQGHCLLRSSVLSCGLFLSKSHSLKKGIAAVLFWLRTKILRTLLQEHILHSFIVIVFTISVVLICANN